MKKTLISTILLSLTSTGALAHSTTKTFDVKRGYAETFSISQSEQLGQFKAVLKLVDGSRRHKNKLILQGAIKGVLNSDFTLAHSFVNYDRSGVIYTMNDSIINFIAGDPTCENGTGSTPFEVEEILNIVAGSGVYADIEAGSFILLKGV